ncbi:malate:citrate symporter [Candidatus Phytoplasma ziziphi]|uniref:Malate:citrate symporter n=1 Tax=Ziziphus jujuba witches'-broom phytoplasma TaxID=135727 RepID=A0A660HMG4_ZIZJU|nr:2-hydroxycarboxylate transporter family protein [Candidatus Phytoplasma ziziphi]AYJ01069.1 malate:citrate symporter [Candidatus Phytoplasma ziziphi]
MPNVKKKIKIFGLYPIIFLILFFILICNIYYIQSCPDLERIDITKQLWNSCLTSLFFIMIFGIGLNFIGDKIPFFNKLGLGFLLCILVPSFLVYKKIICKDIHDQLKFFIFEKKGINFAKIFIVFVVIGSILNIERNLLKRVIIKFIPLSLLTVLVSFLMTGLLGYLLNYKPDSSITKSRGPFIDSIFFISVPLTNGGTNLGINSLAEPSYEKCFGIGKEKLKSIFLAPLILARCVSIFLAGVLYLFFNKTKYSGQGQLEKQKTNHIVHNISKDVLDYKNIGSGLLIILGMYSLCNMINQMLSFNKTFGLDTMVYIIFLSLIIKIFNLISDEYQKYIVQIGKFMSVNFTAPALVALGLDTDFNILLLGITNYRIICMVFVSLMIAITVSFYLALLLNFNPLESSLILGISSHSIGSTGNLGVMSISNRMYLLPFAMIITRITGIFVFIFSSFCFIKIYQ